ncbi:hypothetical protein ACIQWL_09200 [Streptomyces mirabilis]|uniref:hypothetical protein n=1 Tax=Streptomyces mirabilis TaxID=68239 RepID=UPI00381119EA
MPLFTNRQLIIGVGLVVLIVLLLSCTAAVRDEDTGGCRSLGLAAAPVTARPRPAAPPVAPRVPVHKEPAPSRTARQAATSAPARTGHTTPTAAPARTVTAHPHGHGGVDIDLDVCP